MFGNRDLRHLELAAIGANLGGWAYWITIALFAYEAGGAAAVGFVAFIRLLASAAAAPVAGLLADRFPRQRVMLAADLVRALALAVASAATFADAPASIVYALAVVIALATTAAGPAQAALLPSLARTPEELTAANVISSTIESVALFIGPALAGFLLAATDTGFSFAATAVAFLISALFTARISADARPEREQGEGSRVVSELLAGVRTIGRESRLRLLVGLFAAQTFVDGLLTVLLVVTALDLLDLGEAGVGLFNSAVGIGGLFGGLLAAALVGRGRLAGNLGVGIALWGMPIVLIGIYPHTAATLVLLAIVGVGNTLLDVAGYTLLQRSVADDVLARAFAVLESVILGAIALGSALAPLLTAALGIRASLVVTGALLPVIAALVWPHLRRIDAASAVEPRAELLRAVPIFTPLPSATLESLASHLGRFNLPEGEVLFRAGDRGDRFWIVGAGEVEVAVADEPPVRLGPGDHFGEIALLRDVPRTATVRALSRVELYSLERDDFVAAVTGHAASRDVADSVVATRLGSLRPRVFSV